MKIKILGAGIGGLSTAIALRKNGFNVEVYERHECRSDIGAGIICWPNASFVLDQLGLLSDIAKHSGLPTRMNRRSSEGEELGMLNLLDLNEKMGYSSFSILRLDLMRVLESHAKKLGVEIKYGNRIEKLVSSKAGYTGIFLDNGNIEHADAIIGADGRMSSVTREFVKGENTPVYQGFINWIGVYKSRNPIFHDIQVTDYWGVGKRFGIVPVSSTIAYWAGGVSSSTLDEKDPQNYQSDLLSLFRNWPSPIETLIRETHLANINKLYVHDHNPMERWHKDNALVIGDAAHAALPTSGQGACQALEDAWHLANLFKKYEDDLESIYNKFTEHRFSKTTGITMGARQLASSLFNTDPGYCVQRNKKSIGTDYEAVVSGMATGWSSGLPIGV